jgi:hypothetical protein
VTDPPADIVWIASYPKSGNTWLRFLLCNLAFGPIDSAAVLNSLAPDLHELQGALQPTGRRLLVKTHFPYSPHLPLQQRTAAAVYIVRDPADVMLSNFHYSRRSERQGALELYVDRYISSGGDPRWLNLGMGTWAQNVLSWVGVRHEQPVLTLRYEDLLQDPFAGAHSLCRFLSLERSPDDIAGAVANSSFERMRDIEAADIRARRTGIFFKPYLEQPINAGLRFMRSGRSGEAAGALSEMQWARFDATFGALRRKLGYGG